MKLTKYAHACFTLEKDGQILVVDPGVLSKDFVVTDTIVGIIVTHSHPDHFDPDTLAKIYDKNPDSILFSTTEVVEKMVDHTPEVVVPGEKKVIGNFDLTFFGGEHAVIHKDVPIIDNVGVLINETVYYPGDSFVLPNIPVDTLAVPVGAPWLKTSESIDFMMAINPRLAFATHNGLLSDDGKDFTDAWLKRFADPAGITYSRLDGQTIDI